MIFVPGVKLHCRQVSEERWRDAGFGRIKTHPHPAEHACLNALPVSRGPGGEDFFERVAECLEREGFGVFDASVPDAVLLPLLERSRNLSDADWRPAGIGRDADYQRNRFVRGDRVHWPAPDDEGSGGYRAWSDELRLALNRRLFLGLFDYEFHYARYPVGSFYRRHFDAFRGGGNRVVSSVLYLNPDWGDDHGGELVIHGAGGEALRVAPRFGTLAVFLSEEIEHEVLPASRPRYSVTGWFRVNGSIAGEIDPPR